jgi:stearoyl-CoA desaturase (delta-9 desaturase)
MTMRRVGLSFVRWFDAWAGLDLSKEDEKRDTQDRSIDWLRVLPFALMHVAAIAVIWVGWSPVAVAVAIGLYVLRMFAITAFYHRYFSHRTFKTSRVAQFLFAAWAMTSIQRGPIWWASHHRHHHRHSDEKGDVHSPRQDGFLWSHVLWLISRPNYAPRLKLVPDLMRYPELRFLDRFDILVPTLFALALFGFGEALALFAPGLGTNGWQMLVWGFVISTLALFHGTFTINSLAHSWGRQRFKTGDDSRNSWVLALITLGEGWHNNHHRYPGSVRQGFYWWEFDPTYYALRVLEALGIVWDLNPVPARVLEDGRTRKAA